MKNHRSFIAVPLLALCAFAGAAHAHSSLAEPEARAGGFYKATIRIPHGCDGKPTTGVKMDLPEGFIAAQPQVKPGWTIETVKGDYQRGYKLHGKDVTTGLRQVTWSGGYLPDAFYDEFTVAGQLAPFDQDTTLSFPVTQYCGGDASIAWTQIAADGQNPHDLDHPAPQLHVLAAADGGEHGGHGGHGGHKGQDHHAAAQAKAGDLVITAPSVRAMVPGAKVAGGYLTIANGGKQDDRLVAVTAPDVKRVEIHEMSMQGQVMKMRRLDGGLDLPAGTTVQLKSGGYHLMFIQPEKPYEEGQSVPVTLDFEKAGTVEIAFPVTAASGRADAHSGH